MKRGTAAHLNGLPRPNINNKYDNINSNQQQSNENHRKNSLRTNQPTNALR